LKPFFASSPFEDLFKRYQKALQYVVTGYQKAHQYVVTGYQKVHRGAIDWLESVGTVVSSYCILQEGPDTHSWIYTSSLFVKAHSESIITLAGILFALVCIDFAITACLSRSKPVKTKKVSKVSSTSLLRKAKNLPRPPSASLLNLTTTVTDQDDDETISFSSCCNNSQPGGQAFTRQR
jgi:hypothetical protein